MYLTTEDRVKSLIDDLLEQGVIAITYCCTESADIEIEHYQLLECGQEADPDCIDFGKMPIISDGAKKVLSDFVNDKAVKLYPRRYLPVWYDPPIFDWD